MRNDFGDMRVLTPRAFKKLPTAEQNKNNYLVGTSQSGYKFYMDHSRKMSTPVVNFSLKFKKKLSRKIMVKALAGKIYVS